MYEDRTQNYDPEIHEESHNDKSINQSITWFICMAAKSWIYPFHCHIIFIAMFRQTTAHGNATIFCCDCESKIRIFEVFLKKTFNNLNFFLVFVQKTLKT